VAQRVLEFLQLCGRRILARKLEQPLEVLAGRMTTQIGNASPTSEVISQASVPSRSRLYLRKSDSYPATCDAQQPLTQTLTSSAGTWRLTGGTSAFPTDTSALAPSIVCVPKRLHGNPPDNSIAPEPERVRSWSGKFSGNLITPTQYTKFALYTNQSLFPGWQQDPCVAGGQFVPNSCPVLPLPA